MACRPCSASPLQTAGHAPATPATEARRRGPAPSFGRASGPTTRRSSRARTCGRASTPSGFRRSARSSSRRPWTRRSSTGLPRRTRRGPPSASRRTAPWSPSSATTPRGRARRTCSSACGRSWNGILTPSSSRPGASPTSGRETGRRTSSDSSRPSGSGPSSGRSASSPTSAPCTGPRTCSRPRSCARAKSSTCPCPSWRRPRWDARSSRRTWAGSPRSWGARGIAGSSWSLGTPAPSDGPSPPSSTIPGGGPRSARGRRAGRGNVSARTRSSRGRARSMRGSRRGRATGRPPQPPPRSEEGHADRRGRGRRRRGEEHPGGPPREPTQGAWVQGALRAPRVPLVRPVEAQGPSGPREGREPEAPSTRAPEGGRERGIPRGAHAPPRLPVRPRELRIPPARASPLGLRRLRPVLLRVLLRPLRPRRGPGREVVPPARPDRLARCECRSDPGARGGPCRRGTGTAVPRGDHRLLPGPLARPGVPPHRCGRRSRPGLRRNLERPRGGRLTCPPQTSCGRSSPRPTRGGAGGREPVGTRPAPRPVDAALRLAKPNGLLTAVGLGLAAEGIEIPEGWRPEFEAERRSLEACRASLRLIREVASDDGLAVAVIKNVSALEHAPRDVDVFVPEAERPVLLDALRARGLGTVYDDGAELSLCAAGLARIDVYSRLRYLGRDFLSPAYIVASRSPVRSLGIEHPSLTPAATLLLHSAPGLFGPGSLTL